LETLCFIFFRKFYTLFFKFFYFHEGWSRILPSEVEKIVLPNLQNFDDSIAKELISKIDRTIRNNEDIEPTLVKLMKLFWSII
jgi:hypothetical protein